MTFPTALIPSSRSFDAGDWPVKRFRSQSGVEASVVYGSRRFGASLNLAYANVADADAELFLDHYVSVKGTSGTFFLGDRAAGQGVRSGWAGDLAALGADATAWRYAEPPTLEQVKPGVSTVTIKLLSVI